ncbi:glucokinase [Rhodobium orientis]|uniref:Glucokinase n=1 Tax=Rhodobium orientis TaxID=34017 RepID=A0A327JN05_9HYPH|nr:glucokinase [Rhodobium orientis]MBB4304638.1 glucokinase [Rhodobium orientis]MBK5950013.1 glucokinase [Rhodobium orientis]RAI27707.1 glucokinase [Rhodobium orientis]
MTDGAPLPQHLHFPLVLADLGGTNLRLGYLADPAADMRFLKKVKVADYPGLGAAMAAVLAEFGTRVRTAIIAFAGPVGGDDMRLTNHPWDITPKKVAGDVGLDEVILVNDFAAQALALPGLDAGELSQIGGRGPVAHAAKLVLGPGTGLGVAGLVPSPGGWVPVAGEAGHVELGPGDDDEEIWRHLERIEGRVTAETVISGPGLLRLYRAVCAAAGSAPTFDAPEKITAAAKDDALAGRALECFVAALGRTAGDLALVFLAKGGVFLSGGIAPRIVPWLQAGGFRAAFEAKAPHRDLVTAMPVYVVTTAEPALAGLCALAKGTDRFAIDLSAARYTA